MADGENNENKEAFKGLATAGVLGFTLVLATFVGLALGIFVDKITGLKPIFTISGLLFGIIAGFVNIFIKTKNL